MKRLRITLEGKSYELDVEVLNEPAPASEPPAAASSAVQPQAVASSATRPKVAASAPAAAAQPVAEGATTVFCPMAGKVIKCPAKPGDTVALNQPVIILEAMKMESSINAPVAGTVRSVLVKEGDAVEEGQALMHIDGGAQ